MRRRLRLFRKITGMKAVTTLATSLPEPSKQFAFSPPVHPQCARRLRTVRTVPCGDQWLIHVKSSRDSERAHSHTCPIGLRCACVPIHFGGHLVGVAKLVADPAATDASFSAAMDVLKLVVSEVCQELVVSVLSEEVRDLRQRVVDFQRILARGSPGATGSGSPIHPIGAGEAEGQNPQLVHRVLAYLQKHYEKPDLSLSGVGAALGCNPKYLTTRFTLVVGERMHTYLLGLRVARACELLLGTHLSVKEIAHASGFSSAGRLARAFRGRVGVSPSEYRRIFSGP